VVKVQFVFSIGIKTTSHIHISEKNTAFVFRFEYSGKRHCLSTWDSILVSLRKETFWEEPSDSSIQNHNTDPQLGQLLKVVDSLHYS